jgi:hypothetical protein
MQTLPLLKDEAWIRQPRDLSPAMQEFVRQLEAATALRLAQLDSRRAARCVKEKALRDAGVPFDQERWAR